MDLPQSLIIRIGMLSYPYALSTFRFFIIRFISSSVKVIFSILLFILNSEEGSWLLAVIGVHWETKYKLKNSVFSTKFKATLSSRIGGIMGIIILLKNLLKTDQRVLEAVLGSSSLPLSRMKFFSLAAIISLVHSFAVLNIKFLLWSVGSLQYFLITWGLFFKINYFILLFIYTFILKNKKKVLQSHNYIRLFTPLPNVAFHLM